MAGDAEAAGMGDALAVAQQQCRKVGQLFQGLEYRRNLPEGQQAGNVGEGGGHFSDALPDQLQRQ